MARGHWLDPLARRLLMATGQIAPPPPLCPEPSGASGAEAAVERDLLALKLKQNPALRLRDAQEVRHAAALGWRLDVNRATPPTGCGCPAVSRSRLTCCCGCRPAG